MSGQNYIGSKISLISSSDIRYVGILHNINSFDSTVALQNVTSFGTEGRKQDPREEILGSETVFDYVVFRGSDIKDLQVFEAPPTFQNPYPPYYQHMNMPVPENYRVAPQHVVQEKVAVAESVDEALVDSLIKEVSDLDIQMAPSSIKEIGLTSNVKREEKKRQVETIGRRDENTRKRDENNYKRKEETARKRDEKKNGETARKIKDNGIKKDYRKNGKKEDAFKRGDRHNRGDTTTKRQESFKREDSFKHQDSFKKDRRSSHRRPSGFVVPKSDFDFASSNAKFDKNYIQQQTETTQEPDHFYDKKKSFFDDISCEHKEQGTTRSFKEESKLNLETFGQANIRHRSRHRGRSSHNNTKLKSF